MKKQEVQAFATMVGRCNPLKYGTKGNLYPQMASDVAQQVSKSISDSNGSDLPVLFQTLLPWCGDQRRSIAIEMGSSPTNAFGLLRTELAEAINLVTPLTKEYQLVSESLWRWLKNFSCGTHKVIEDTYSRVTVTCLTRDEAIEKGYFTRSGKAIRDTLYELSKGEIVSLDPLLIREKKLFPLCRQVDLLTDKPVGTAYRCVRGRDRSSKAQHGTMLQFYEKRGEGKPKKTMY